MKIKYLIAGLGVCSLLTVGVYYGRETWKNYKSVTTAVESGNELVQEYNTLVGDSTSLQEQLSTAGKDIILDNTRLACAFAELDGATVNEIDALEDAADATSVLISITNPDDVAFFTDTVAAIVYSFTITDANAFLNALGSATFIANDVDIDLVNNTARIVVPSSSTLYANHLTSNSTSNTAAPSANVDDDDDTTEANDVSDADAEGVTESVSIPENSGVYDSSENVTSGSIGSDNTTSDDNFNANYYVIDSTEGE